VRYIGQPFGQGAIGHAVEVRSDGNVIRSNDAGKVIDVVHHALNRLPALAQERPDKRDADHAASVGYGLGLLVAEVT